MSARPSSFSSIIVGNNSTLTASGSTLSINGNALQLAHPSLATLTGNTFDIIDASNIGLAVNIFSSNTIVGVDINALNSISCDDFMFANYITANIELHGTLTDSATKNIAEVQQVLTIVSNDVGWDMADGGYAKLSLTDSADIENPTNYRNGGRYILEISYTSNTAHVVTWGSNFHWPSGVAPTLTRATGKKDIFTFNCSNNLLYGIPVLNYS